MPFGCDMVYLLFYFVMIIFVADVQHVLHVTTCEGKRTESSHSLKVHTIYPCFDCNITPSCIALGSRICCLLL